ncbi:hypothetical protein G6F66_014457 [Rhizopus arrhizus]|nr:hypothetical protein G6F66_014457 [Rhizopus arrhizus]
MSAGHGRNLHIDSTATVPALPHFKENSMPAQYHISLPDPSKARGNDPDLSFHSQGAAGFAEELQDALRSGTLFERWKAKQPDPDAVEPQWGATAPDATVPGEQKALRINLVATTRSDRDVFKQRLRLLAGHHWELRDVR